MSVDEDDDLVKLPPLPGLAASLQLHPAPEPEHDGEGAGCDPASIVSADSSLVAERAAGAEWTVAAGGPGTPRKGLYKTLSHISEGDEVNSRQESPQRQGAGYSGSPGGSPAVRSFQGAATNNAVPWRRSPSKAQALPRNSSPS